MHVGRATTDGFQIVEVWESKEHYDRANTEVVFPLMRELGGDQLLHSTEQATEAFDVRGLVIPKRQHPDLTEWGVIALKHAADGLVAPHIRGIRHPLPHRWAGDNRPE